MYNKHGAKSEYSVKSFVLRQNCEIFPEEAVVETAVIFLYVVEYENRRNGLVDFMRNGHLLLPFQYRGSSSEMKKLKLPSTNYSFFKTLIPTRIKSIIRASKLSTSFHGSIFRS
jgi:hypothetical protein